MNHQSNFEEYHPSYTYSCMDYRNPTRYHFILCVKKTQIILKTIIVISLDILEQKRFFYLIIFEIKLCFTINA